MSIVNIRDVTFLNNPARFSDEYQFRVTFECIAPLKEDLEWKLIFVSSPDSEQYDQELDDCMVGPVPVGINSFTFSAPPPEPQKIPKEDVLGVAAIILTASYKEQEFVRVGYYQNTEYDDPEMNAMVREEGVKSDIQWHRLVRNLADKPRVTRFSIKWDVEEAQQPSAPTPSFLTQPQQQFPPQQQQFFGNNPYAQTQQQYGQPQHGYSSSPQQPPFGGGLDEGQSSSISVPPAGMGP